MSRSKSLSTPLLGKRSSTLKPLVPPGGKNEALPVDNYMMCSIRHMTADSLTQLVLKLLHTITV